MSELIKIVVFVPEDGADALRQAIGAAGAGQIGNYSYCSFSVKGTGRFLPGEDAHPAIGAIGKLETVAEERVEVVCPRDQAAKVLKAIRATHPYEEPAIDIYPLLPEDAV